MLFDRPARGHQRASTIASRRPNREFQGKKRDNSQIDFDTKSLLYRRLSELALTSSTAFGRLEEEESQASVGVRQAVLSNSVLDNCYFTPRCSNRARFRTIEGECNNLRFPLYGKTSTPLQRILRNAYADGRHSPR